MFSPLIFSWPATMWRPAIVMVRVVRLSVCHTRISPKLSEIDIWLLGNSNRKLIPDSESAIRFAIGSTVLPFWVFPGWQTARNGSVGLVNVVYGSVGTVTSRHHTGHRGGPAIVTSHNGRNLVIIDLRGHVVGGPSDLYFCTCYCRISTMRQN